MNRHVHLPAFIRLLADHCTVLGLGAKSVDYRRRAEVEALAEHQADGYIVGEGLEARWQQHLRLVGPEAPVLLELPLGRQLHVARAAQGACHVSFRELCASDRGEADFYALAQRFHTVYLDGVPRWQRLRFMRIGARLSHFQQGVEEISVSHDCRDLQGPGSHARP